MDAWWGLRSSADGDSDGIPVAVFGGEHGDAPLERTGGKLMADLVVDEGLSMVLSLKHFGSRAAERQFAMDFLERLYRRNSDLVHLLIDEADLFAPQRPQAGDQPLLGITENIVRRGRNSGIGVTLITQRPAVLNKDVLTQVDGLVAMRMLGPQDRNAIDAWVGEHGDSKLAGEVKASLPDLQTGDSWWWVPELGILKRAVVRRSRTFDSSPTRKRGGKRREPKSFADIDMGSIEEKMAATIERAKADDPKELRKEIAELKRELAKKPAAAPAAEPERVEVEVHVAPPAAVAALKLAGENAGSVERAVREAGEQLRDALKEIDALPTRNAEARATTVRPSTARPAPASRPARRDSRPAPAAPAQRPPEPVDGEFRTSAPQQRILDALANLETIGIDAASKVQLALFAEASPKSSSYTNNLGALRTAGLIDYPGPALVALTDAGRGQADGAGAPSTVEELHGFVRGLVGEAKWRLLSALIYVYPDALSKPELAERVGASVSSSSFTNNLGALRSLGLIDYPQPGLVSALPVLLLRAGA